MSTLDQGLRHLISLIRSSSWPTQVQGRRCNAPRLRDDVAHARLAHSRLCLFGACRLDFLVCVPKKKERQTTQQDKENLEMRPPGAT
jgi:hypothetical protein